MRLRQPTRVRKGPQEAFDIMAALRRYVSGLSTGGHLSREIASRFIDELDRAGGILLARKDKAEGYQILEELSSYVADEASGELPEYIIEYLVEAIDDIIGNLRPEAKETSMKMRRPVGKAAGERPGHPTPEGHVFVDVGRGRSFYKRTYPRHIMEDIGIVYGVDEMAGDGVPAAYFFDKRYGWTAESAKEFCEDRSVNIAEGMDIIKGVVHLRRPFRKQDYSDFGRGGSAHYRGDANKALFRFTRNVEEAGGGPFEFHDLMGFAPWVSETQMLEMIDRLKADGILAQTKVGSRILFHIIGSQAAKHPIEGMVGKQKYGQANYWAADRKLAWFYRAIQEAGGGPFEINMLASFVPWADSTDITEWLKQLAADGMLARTMVGNRAYWHIPGSQALKEPVEGRVGKQAGYTWDEWVEKEADYLISEARRIGGEVITDVDSIASDYGDDYGKPPEDKFMLFHDIKAVLERKGVEGMPGGDTTYYFRVRKSSGKVGKSAEIVEEQTIGYLDEHRPDLTLVTMDTDVAAIKEHLGIDDPDIGGFFVIVGEGDYDEVWGYPGTVPGLHKPAYRYKIDQQTVYGEGHPLAGKSAGKVGKQDRAFVYIVDMDERGEWRAHVDDQDDKVVLELEPWVFEDGWMKHDEDLNGLLAYLIHLGIAQEGDDLVHGQKGRRVGKQSRQLVENVYRRLAWQLDGEAALEVLEAEMNQYPAKEVHRAIDVLVDEGRIEIAGDVVRVLAGVTKQESKKISEDVFHVMTEAGEPVDGDYIASVLPEYTDEQINMALLHLRVLKIIRYKHPSKYEIAKQLDEGEPAFEEFWTEDIKDIILGLLERNKGEYVPYSKIAEAAIEQGIDDDATAMDMLAHLESQELIEGKHLEDEPAWRLKAKKEVGKRVKFKKRVPIKKIDAKHRVVYGVVYSPHEVDTQDDWSDEDEILKAVHYYMMHSQQIGKNHIEMMGGKAAVVECGYAHADWPPFRKGEWFMGTKILDDDEWRQVENGEITGYSMGGDGLRVERGIPAGSAA